ncbi:MAG TPA: GvpL/GvpF family gas vesicle protein [Thermoanaerobaculia bacterium]|nr:GvpL/GvpF family gas vesicle protein [Thermoanaerobaculia bacterium]
MKYVILGAHLHREDVEPLAAALQCSPESADPLWLSAIEAADDQPLGDREFLLRATKVRAALLERATFIAIRYGFAAHSAGDASKKAAPHLRHWRELLVEHRGRVEMTLKVAAANPVARPERSSFSSGADYLKALHASSNAAHVEPEFRAAVDAAVRPLAAEARWVHRDNSSIELAFLLPGNRIDEVRAVAEALKREFPRVPFLLSGPWPLEVFADADHE